MENEKIEFKVRVPKQQTVDYRPVLDNREDTFQAAQDVLMEQLNTYGTCVERTYDGVRVQYDPDPTKETSVKYSFLVKISIDFIGRTAR